MQKEFRMLLAFLVLLFVFIAIVVQSQPPLATHIDAKVFVERGKMTDEKRVALNKAIQLQIEKTVTAFNVSDFQLTVLIEER